MSVPLTLLGLLERGPSHGYHLKRGQQATGTACPIAANPAPCVGGSLP